MNKNKLIKQLKKKHHKRVLKPFRKLNKAERLVDDFSQRINKIPIEFG